VYIFKAWKWIKLHVNKTHSFHYHDRNFQTSKASLESQAQGTSFSRALHQIRGWHVGLLHNTESAFVVVSYHWLSKLHAPTFYINLRQCLFDKSYFLQLGLCKLDFTTAPHSTLVSLECLERVFSIVARIIGGIPRTGHVSGYIIHVLHWLPFQQRMIFPVATLVWRCLWPCSDIPARSLLSHPGNQRSQFPRLCGTGDLFAPFACTSTRLTRAFSLVGPSVWNGLTLTQRLLPRVHSGAFYSSLKTVLCSRTGIGSASE